MRRNERYPYVVVPSPGMYGDGQVAIVSRHATRKAAERAASRETQRLQRAMERHGGSSGYYYAAEHARDTFWADTPPAGLAE